MRFIYAAFLSLMIVGEVDAQTIETALNCSKRIPHDTEYSTGGRIRADQVFLCVSQDGKRASLHYRASAMHNEKFVGYDNSPWLRLTLHGSNGSKIYEKSDFDLADVERCGGYTGHWKIIPISESDVAKIEFFEISLGRTGSRSCSPQGWDRVIYDAKNTVERWAEGDLTETEKKIMSVVEAGGF